MTTYNAVLETLPEVRATEMSPELAQAGYIATANIAVANRRSPLDIRLTRAHLASLVRSGGAILDDTVENEAFLPKDILPLFADGIAEVYELEGDDLQIIIIDPNQNRIPMYLTEVIDNVVSDIRDIRDIRDMTVKPAESRRG